MKKVIVLRLNLFWVRWNIFNDGLLKVIQLKKAE